MSGSRTQTPILLGTGNRTKQETLRQLLVGLPVSPITPQELSVQESPPEDGETHQAIAESKAKHWSRAASMLAIASDGGLIIPALGSRWESLYTHRFAGAEAGNHERTHRLLELMAPYRGADRKATWVEALAIAHRGRLLVSWELAGATGVIAETVGNAEPPSEFWVFSLWDFPELGKGHNSLSPGELAAMDDHWLVLRRLVCRFFDSHFVAP